MKQHGQTQGDSARPDWQDMSPPLTEKAEVLCFKIFPLPWKK